MRILGLLALVLSVGMFVGCPQEAKKKPMPKAGATEAQPGGEQKAAEPATGEEKDRTGYGGGKEGRGGQAGRGKEGRSP